MKNHEILNTESWKIREDVEITAERLISTNLNIEFQFKFDPQEEYVCDKLLMDMILAFNPPQYEIEKHPLYQEVMFEMRTGRMHYTFDELVQVCTKHGVDITSMDGHMIRPEAVAKHLSAHHMGGEPIDFALEALDALEDKRAEGDHFAQFTKDQLNDPRLVEGILEFCREEKLGKIIEEDFFPIDQFPSELNEYMNPSEHYAKIRQAQEQGIDIGSTLSDSTSLTPFNGSYAYDEDGNIIDVEMFDEGDFSFGSKGSNSAHSSNSSQSHNNEEAQWQKGNQSSQNQKGKGTGSNKSNSSNPGKKTDYRKVSDYQPEKTADPIGSFVNTMSGLMGMGIDKLKPKNKSAIYATKAFRDKVVESIHTEADAVDAVQLEVEALLNEPESKENADKLSVLMGTNYLKSVASLALKSKEAADKISNIEPDQADKIAQRIKKMQKKHEEISEKIENEKSEMYKKITKAAIKIAQMIMAALSHVSRLIQKVKGQDTPSPA